MTINLKTIHITIYSINSFSLHMHEPIIIAQEECIRNYQNGNVALSDLCFRRRRRLPLPLAASRLIRVKNGFLFGWSGTRIPCETH